MAKWVAVCGCAFVVLAHAFVLMANNLSVLASPISALSSGQWAFVHTAGLVGFALAHFGLWCHLSQLSPQSSGHRLWRFGRAVLLLNGVLIVFVAAYFALAPAAQLSGPDANDPLSLLASSTGLCMGLLARGLRSQSAFLYRFNASTMVIWLLLVPLLLLVSEQWLGGYERLVGLIFVAWVCGLALGYRRVELNVPELSYTQRPAAQSLRTR